MKTVLKVFAFVLLTCLAVECLSSYVLYRDYAFYRKPLHPLGLASLDLARKLRAKLAGRHDSVKVSAGPAPVFASDPILGFTIRPGHHVIVEHFDNQSLLFHLTVDEHGRRVTSYAPVEAARRIYIAGDSLIFGWGLDDEETMPWLLQTRLPRAEIVNLSLNTYSTVHALLQLQALAPQIGPRDLIVLSYHEVTNNFNVADPVTVKQLLTGYELQLGGPDFKKEFAVPFGAVGDNGEFSIQRFKISCFEGDAGVNCVHPTLSVHAKILVTERVFDNIVALWPGKVVVAFEHGDDSDEVIQHLRSRGVPIVDLRMPAADPNAVDILPTNNHAGPYRHHQMFLALLNAVSRGDE